MENIRLYTDKYDEEFEPHLRPFTQGVWGLLMKVRAHAVPDVRPVRYLPFHPRTYVWCHVCMVPRLSPPACV